MKATEFAKIITDELKYTLESVNNADAEKLAEKILAARRIFVAGAGRSGFAVKAFAMRLMHMGLEAYVVGETSTPNYEAQDLLVIASGSGETGSLVSYANKAKKIGGQLATVTIRPEGTIGQLADAVVMIPAPTPKANVSSEFHSIQPMGSLFEQSLLLFLDIVVLLLMEKKGNDSATMFTRHATIE